MLNQDCMLGVIVIQLMRLTKLKKKRKKDSGAQKQLYEIAHKIGLWIVLCNHIKVSRKIIKI